MKLEKYLVEAKSKPTYSLETKKLLNKIDDLINGDRGQEASMFLGDLMERAYNDGYNDGAISIMKDPPRFK